MQLKKLEMFGFKSFADKTAFAIGTGTTAFVGPNGCGKSNVVDAIKWVLGEQSAKSLRGKEMQDVIFNGTHSRPQLGYAEVSLTIDNSDNKLPVDFQEVCVTRRLFRTGESEYLVNRQPSRLRDIREMFLGTGVGMNCYSVIEQGNVEQIVNSSPFDRRVVFEEAAGISRFKNQKKQALVKLERVEQNLLRVNDIIEEIQKQLRSVKLQAARARKYKEYSDELRLQRCALSLFRSRELVARCNGAGEELGRLQKDSDALSAGRREAEQKQQALIKAIEEIDSISAQERADLASLNARLTNARHDLDINRQRIAEIEEQRGSQGQRRADLQARIAQLETERESGRADMRKVADDIRNLSTGIDTQNVELQQLQFEIDRLNEEAEEKKTQIIELHKEESILQNILGTLSSNRSRLEGRRIREAGAIQEREAAVAEITRHKESAGGQLQDLDASREKLQKAQKDGQERLETLSWTLDELNSELTRLKTELSARHSERNVLNDLEKRQEGVGAGVKAVLKAAADGEQRLAGIMCMVADAIRVPDQHAAAIDAAIAGNAQSVIIDTPASATSAVTYVREKNPGRVGFIPLSGLMSPAEIEPEGLPDGCIPAGDIVECDAEIEPVVARLLANTWIAPDVSSAVAFAHNGCPVGVRLVTPAGDIVESHGAITGGQAREMGLISRKSRLAKLDKEIAKLTEDHAAAEEKRREIVDETTRVRRQVDQLRQQLQETLVRFTAKQGEVERLQSRIQQMLEEQELARAELLEIDREIRETSEKEAKRMEDLGLIQEQRQKLQSEATRADDQVKIKSFERNGLAVRISDLRAELAGIQSRRDSIEAMLRRIEQGKSETENDLAAMRGQDEQNEHRRREAQARIAESERFCEAHAGIREEHEQRLRDLDAERNKARESLELMRQGMSGLQEREDEIQQKVGRAQMDQIESRTRLEGMNARILDDYRIWLPVLDAPPEQLEDPALWPEEPPEQEVPDPAQQAVVAEALAEQQTSALVQPTAGAQPPVEGAPAQLTEAHETDEMKPAVRINVREETCRFREAIRQIADSPETDWVQVENASKELKNRIDRIGSVNLDAIRQQEELEEREKFLVAQKSDLEQSRQSLQEVIRKINHTSRELFKETFEKIQEQFSILFRKLFGGGKAELLLQENVDILEAGVEIIARPPGKEPKSLTLLSGGEKVMTTIALLFAIFRCKPSPFCFLDEVDAALDESNIGRFLVLLSEYARESQFLIITHNKRTMSIADVLYGVTQEELGVSKSVRVEFSEVEQHLQDTRPRASGAPEKKELEVPAAE
ncbi:MAG TPA: chromosome segregation protein SMC [Candidatus Brocadiia bacterium]|nr:chromosome segregation protein SMC [Candidatus Brocadiia bacterium]